MPRAVVQVGVAGLGTIGRVHAENLLGRIPGARLARVVDAAPTALAAAGDLAGVPRSTSFGDLLDDRHVDAVVIATPPSTHPELIAEAARAGKHVLCEKPLALDIREAIDALAAVQSAGVLLQMGFHRRFDRDFSDAKSRIARGDVGRIRTYHGSMRDMELPPIEMLRTGEQTLLHGTACHDFDAARWLVGEIDELSTHGAALASPTIGELGQVDHAVSLLRFEGGALGIIENSLASGYGFDCRCEITGSKATLRVDRPYSTAVERLARPGGGCQRTATFLERFADAYPRELDAFVGAVAKERPVEVDGDDGLAAVVLATAAERSLEHGERVRLRHTRTGGRLRYELDRRPGDDRTTANPSTG